MTDYSNGKIYVLRNSIDDSIFYVGSTTLDLENRLYYHLWESSNEKRNTNVYVHMRKIGQQCYIENYADFACSSPDELHRKEGEVVKVLKEQGVILTNMVIPGRSKQEHYYDNHEEMLKIAKEYREKNKEKLSQVLKCKECDGEYTYYNMGAHKKSASHRKAIGLEPLTFDCECGAKDLDILNKHHHVKTLQHLKFLGKEAEFVHKDLGKYTCECGSEIVNVPDKIKRHKAGPKHKFLMLPEDERNQILKEKEKIRKEKYNATQNRCYHQRMAKKKEQEDEEDS